MYYVLSLAWLLELIHPSPSYPKPNPSPNPSLSLSLSLCPSLSLSLSLTSSPKLIRTPNKARQRLAESKGRAQSLGATHLTLIRT